MDVLAERFALRVGQDHVLAHVLGVRARVADALDALDGVHPAQELGERHPVVAAQVAPVGVHVLAEQRDLPHAVAGEALDLGEQLGRRARLLAAACRRHDAVRADAVAPLGDLEPCLELARALHRQMPGEALELEEALRADRVRGQELGEAADLPRPEGDVHEREPLEDLVFHRLRPATADADDPARVLGLEPLRLAQVRDEARISRLADRAGVEEDQVCPVALGRLGVAERLEHAAHALRVVLVHLAPEGGYVVARHPRAG